MNRFAILDTLATANFSPARITHDLRAIVDKNIRDGFYSFKLGIVNTNLPKPLSLSSKLYGINQAPKGFLELILLLNKTKDNSIH